MIPSEKIEQIKEANDIVEVINDYIFLTKAGSNYKALCPFHQEKTPSFIVSPQKQIFHCFGCNVGGNVFSFIQKFENLTFIESVKLLAKRAGISTDEYVSEFKSSEKEKILEINKEALIYFRQQFLKSEKSLEYIKKRGISEEAAEEFKLGYAPKGNKLFLTLKEKKFTEDIILKSWLCQKKEKDFTDIFGDRLIFPVFNIFSEPIAFGGRVFDDSLPKYINSADTPVYSKGKNLYNLNNAKKYKDEYIVIVEGYMDAIRLFSEGIKNVVASLGTALTENQAKILKRYYSKIVILYDMDEAGRKAAIRAGEIGFKAGLEVMVALYSDAKDPDEFIKIKGIDEMKKTINKAVPFINYKIDFLKQNGDIKNSYYKEKVLDDMTNTLVSVDNLVVVSDAMKKISQLLSIDEAIVEKYIEKNRRKTDKEDLIIEGIKDFKPIKKSVELAERAVLQYAIISLGTKGEDLILKHIFNSMKMVNIDYRNFNNKIFAELLMKIEEYYSRKEKDIFNKMQIDYIENENIINLISELSSEAEKDINKTAKIIQIINDCVDKIEKEKINEEVRVLQNKIEEAEKAKDYELVNTLMKEKQTLVKIIKKRGDDIE